MSNLILQLKKLFFSTKCSMCGKQLRHDEEYLCPICLKYLEAEGGLKKLDNCYFLYFYDKRVRRLIENYKLSNQRGLGKYIAEISASKIKKVIERERISLVIPVPISAGRYRERGFNQVEEILELGGIGYGKMERIRDTKQMYKLRRREERKANLQDVFRAEDTSVNRGERILIVDDILTTGATVEAIIKELRESFEIGEIYVFTLSLSTKYMEKGIERCQ